MNLCLYFPHLLSGLGSISNRDLHIMLLNRFLGSWGREGCTSLMGLVMELNAQCHSVLYDVDVWEQRVAFTCIL